jgi:hypothetical protein
LLYQVTANPKLTFLNRNSTANYRKQPNKSSLSLLIIRRNFNTDSKKYAGESTNEKEKSFRENLIRFAKIARPELNIVLLAIFLLLISSTVTMTVPLSIGTIIDIVMEDSKHGKAEETTSPNIMTSAMPDTSMLRERIKSLGSLNMIMAFFVGIFIIGSAANSGRYILLCKLKEYLI